MQDHIEQAFTEFSGEWHGHCKVVLREMNRSQKNMNATQDKPGIRFIGQSDFASEILPSGKPALSVFAAAYPL